MASIKCVVVGDGGVGKTSLLTTYVTNIFPTDSTPQNENYMANMSVQGRAYNLELCDTGGQKAYDRLRPLSYANANIFIIAFSLVDPISFENVQIKWIPELQHYCPLVSVVLCGTKSDLRDDEKTIQRLAQQNQSPITKAQGEQLRQDIKAMAYVECSALHQQGIKELFIQALGYATCPQCVFGNHSHSAKVKESCTVA
eukprot:TRINITY_DN4392_c0_g1_i1.p1 TRINITY_DN4392_c0_g1~~TRINITY_DN4392_c0_g1_i1.p1  ORF type:complete len:199 (+),score=8.89 TRINITY_DN4392_c0_g1_i1:43-639(+)